MKDLIGKIKRKNIPFYAEEAEFIAFVNRVTNGKYGDKTTFTLMESKSGFDEYILYARKGKIEIYATSGVAGGTALQAYLKKYCHYYYGILTQAGELPDIPPDTDGELREQSVFHYRYAFNYCTFGYTYAFNDWKDWERVLDYLILAGYNLVLNPIGNESVWVELLQKFGYTKLEAKAYISAPNYLPWQWMMNISAFQGEYPDWWFVEQAEISRKFNARLKAFGMSAVMPGYCGAVPDDFNKKYPNVKILSQGLWQGFVRPSILLPENELFGAISKEYYALQRKLLGCEDMHYYSTDPFHEGGNKESVDLKEYARNVLTEMKRLDGAAVWAFQGWQENPAREMLSALKKEDVLIMNLHADQCPDGGDDFLGYPHIYCVINNFGGEQAMRGSAKNTYYIPHQMASSKKSSCVGIGIMPEGVECDEILFDVVGEVSVRTKLRDLSSFLQEYTLSRYGVVDETLVNVWNILFNKIYTEDIVAYPHESGLIARPEPHVSRVCRWAGSAKVENNDYLKELVTILLRYYNKCSLRESYKKDIVALLRQLIANTTWQYVYGLNEAYANKNKEKFETNVKEFLKLFALQESIVDCDKDLNLQLFLDKAGKRGRTDLEKRWLIKNAKRLITLWGEEKGSVSLHDYAAREYGDMLRFFYKPRWEKYIQKLSDSIQKGKCYEEYDRYADEFAFVDSENTYSRAVNENLLAVATNILQSV